MKSVLTIDDEQALRLSLVSYLEDSEFQMFEASNGLQGLAVLAKESIDLVLCDLKMPTMSGLEFLKAFKELYADVPIIVVSGAGDMQDAIAALRLGAWDYITKPIVDLAVLEHAINKALEKSTLIKDNKLYRQKIEASNIELANNLNTLRADQKAGRSVQDRLLPADFLQFKDYHLHYQIQASLYLSGDFVDYFAIDADHLGFYMADVSGHGASSAFVTILLKSLMGQFLNQFQQGSNQYILQPEQILKLLNTEIYNLKLSKYLTMVYAVLNTKTHQIRYSSGGHYPYPILRQEQTTNYQACKGFPVGISRQQNFKESQITLAENEQLIMFSDGVLEMLPGPSLQAKEDNLLEQVKIQVDAKAIIQKFTYSAVLPDDLSVLIIERQAKKEET